MYILPICEILHLISVIPHPFRSSILSPPTYIVIFHIHTSIADYIVCMCASRKHSTEPKCMKLKERDYVTLVRDC